MLLSPSKNDPLLIMVITTDKRLIFWKSWLEIIYRNWHNAKVPRQTLNLEEKVYPTEVAPSRIRNYSSIRVIFLLKGESQIGNLKGVVVRFRYSSE